MEQINSEQPIASANSDISDQILPTKTNPKSSLPLIIGGLVLIIVVAGVSYYLGMQATSPKNIIQPEDNNSNAVIPVPVDESTVVEDDTISEPVQVANNIPSDWTIKTSEACSVSIPIPPKSGLYYKPENSGTPPSITNEAGSYWQFEEQQGSAFIYTNSVEVFFAHPENASGTAGSVSISCNPGSISRTTDELIAQYEPIANDESGRAPTIKSKRQVTMWGRPVMVVRFEGEFNGDQEYYMFATADNIYMIRKVADSNNQFVRDTTDQIFNNLQFK